MGQVGRMETVMEVWPTSKHLPEFGKKTGNSMCYFVAPSVFTHYVGQIDCVKQTENLYISKDNRRVSKSS